MYFYVGEICFATRSVLESKTKLATRENGVIDSDKAFHGLYDGIIGPFASRSAAEILSTNWNINSVEEANNLALAAV